MTIYTSLLLELESNILVHVNADFFCLSNNRGEKMLYVSIHDNSYLHKHLNTTERGISYQYSLELDFIECKAYTKIYCSRMIFKLHISNHFNEIFYIQWCKNTWAVIPSSDQIFSFFLTIGGKKCKMLYVSKARKVSIEKYIFKIMFSQGEVTSLKIEIEYMYFR